VVLRDNTHWEIPIRLADIKAQKDIGSLMPNGLADLLTRQEFLDLIRFLSELGRPGPYGPSTAQYIRRWRVLDRVSGELAAPIAVGADLPGALEQAAWSPAYSLVSGALPPDVFKPAAVAYARGEIEVQSPGKIRIVLNDPAGLTLWVDQKSIAAAGEMTLDLARGVHVLTVRVDLPRRGNQALRVEIADAPSSAGRARAVGGK